MDKGALNEQLLGKGFKPYNVDSILEDISTFDVIKEPDGTLVTMFKDKVKSRWLPSKLYELVNFRDVVNAFVTNITDKFVPVEYKISITASCQELKIRGSECIINGDTYYEMVWVTNSSNGMKVLTVRYGLMRLICTNGAVATAKGSGRRFALKHIIGNNVNEELNLFMQDLPVLDSYELASRLSELTQKTITVRELADTLVNKIGTPGNDTIWKKLTAKLQSSKTDRLGNQYESTLKGIKVDFSDMVEETLDMQLPAYNVFNCYTEIWRSLDAGQIERETDKILSVLEGTFVPNEA